MIIPRFTSFSDWAHSLIIDFPTDNIPILSDEEKWKEWGDLLVQSNSFSAQGAPSPKFYNEKMEWAEAIFQSMANF